MSGNIHVSGEILVEPTAQEALSRDAQRNQQHADDRKRWWLEIATFSVLTIYAGLTAWQAYTSQRIANLTRNQFATDQRAWIGLEGMTGEDTVGNVFSIKTYFINTGKTPASHFIFQLTSLVDVGVPFHPRYDMGRNTSITDAPGDTTLLPNQKTMQTLHISSDLTDEHIWTQPEADFLRKPNVKLHIFGRACYRDIFDSPHWITFCNVYSPSDRKYYSCETYNEMDDGENGDKENCK